MKGCVCKDKHTDTEGEIWLRTRGFLAQINETGAVRILWFHVSILIIFIDQKQFWNVT